MHTKQATLTRQIKSCRNAPAEIINRLNQVTKHQSIWEQRNTFSLPQLHGRIRCRWNSHLLVLPYFHIIESDQESTMVHLLLFKHRKILTLKKIFGNWKVHRIAAEEFVSQVVPKRHLRTGHLYKTASRSKMKSVERSLSIKNKQLPALTNVNADILINSINIHPHLKALRILADQYVAELDLKINQQKAI